ncbi:hypothetical protein [Jannaschia seosinensis]|uniref:hypothetical protein n=1 Tax=Jannaschia seosinensis TaxID=313367 RepID=UPI001C8FA867|nr:hypothetical protein [Jannaschia seosinensis]
MNSSRDRPRSRFFREHWKALSAIQEEMALSSASTEGDLNGAHGGTQSDKSFAGNGKNARRA